MANFILTGATGFVGSHIAKKFLKNGHSIFVYRRKQSDLKRLKTILPKLFLFDNSNAEDVFKEKKIDAVIHLATSYGRLGEQIVDIIKVNLLLPIQLLELCQKYNVKYFFNTDTFYNSSMGFNNNLNYYALTKEHLKEYGLKISQQFNLNFINIKLFHVYGEDDQKSKFIPKLISDLCLSKNKLSFTSGINKRDFIHVEDVSLAYSLIVDSCLNKKNTCNSFEIGSGISYSIKYLVQLASNLSQSKTILNFGEIETTKNEYDDIKANVSQLSKLNWKANISLEKGIGDLIENYISKLEFKNKSFREK